MTVDYGASTVRLDGYKGDSRRGTVYYACGIGLPESTDTPVRIAQVLPGSPAEAAGIRVGDELVSVNGDSISALSPGERPWEIVMPQPQSKIPVVIRRSGVQQSLKVDYADILTGPKLQ